MCGLALFDEDVHGVDDAQRFLGRRVVPVSKRRELFHVVDVCHDCYPMLTVGITEFDNVRGKTDPALRV